MKNMEALLNEFLPKCGKEQWKIDFVKELCSRDNNCLFEDMLSNQQGDDWDGMFSKRQDWKQKISLQMVYWKLKNDGWITQ